MAPNRWRAIVATAVISAAIAFPVGVIASHQFGDVPDSNPYHNDIDAIADAGVTTGCGGGNYCPSDNVTREQMAAFMNRLGALGAGKTPVVNATKLDGLDSTQFARSDEGVVGHFTCPAPGWHPSTSGDGWAVNTSYSIYSTDGTSVFGCPVLLPDGATITATRWLVADSSASGQVLSCFLRRVADGQLTIMGATATGVGETPSLTYIDGTWWNQSAAVVDNTAYGYAFECTLQGTSDSVRLMLGQVTYTVTGLPVW